METVHLSTKATIFYPTSKIVKILTIGNSKKMLIIINTDSLRNKYMVNIGDTVKNS